MTVAGLFEFAPESVVYNWIVLPLLIFTARIFDVSLGTIRVIFISRGIRNVAAIISFFEILIWLLAISQIMRHIQNTACYIAYAGGFATGTYVGLFIEHKLSLGLRMIRIITKKPAIELIASLKEANFGITSVEAEGTKGKVHLIFTVVRRSSIKSVIELIRQHNPMAFYTIEDIRTIGGGILPQSDFSNRPWRRILESVRKGK